MVNETTSQAAPELPVERVDRLAAELADALDAWQKDTNIPFVAHVHPASTGKGVWYENLLCDRWVADQAKEGEVAE